MHGAQFIRARVLLSAHAHTCIYAQTYSHIQACICVCTYTCVFPLDFPFCGIAPYCNNSNLPFQSCVWKSFPILHFHHGCYYLTCKPCQSSGSETVYPSSLNLCPCLGVLPHQLQQQLWNPGKSWSGNAWESCCAARAPLVGSSDLRLIPPECQTTQWVLHANTFHKKQLRIVPVSRAFLPCFRNPGETHALLEWALPFFFPCEKSKTWKSGY